MWYICYNWQVSINMLLLTTLHSVHLSLFLYAALSIFFLKKFHKIHFISRSPSPISSQIIPTFLPLQLHALFFFLFIKQKCEMTHCHYGRQDNTDVYHCPKHLCILICPSLHPSSLAIIDIFFSFVAVVFSFLGYLVITVPHLFVM